MGEAQPVHVPVCASALQCDLWFSIDVSGIDLLDQQYERL
jgi:hypothetical protein